MKTRFKVSQTNSCRFSSTSQIESFEGTWFGIGPDIQSCKGHPHAAWCKSCCTFQVFQFVDVGGLKSKAKAKVHVA